MFFLLLLQAKGAFLRLAHDVVKRGCGLPYCNHIQKSIQSVRLVTIQGYELVMYQAWLGLKPLAWAWLWWACALEILSQAQIQGLPKPEAWLGLKPRLIDHIWLLLQTASKGIAEDIGS